MGKQLLTFTKEVTVIVERDSLIQAEDMYDNKEITDEQLDELSKKSQWKLTLSQLIK